MTDCLFCKIINNEIPSYTIYEDDMFKVILDIAPATFGHALIIPKRHAKDLYDLSDECASNLMLVAKKVAVAMKESLGIEGLNILQNNGAIASQTVFHYHMHLIPRYENDSMRIGWEIVEQEKSVFEKLVGMLALKV